MHFVELRLAMKLAWLAVVVTFGCCTNGVPFQEEDLSAKRGLFFVEGLISDAFDRVDLICPICRVKRQKVIKFRNTFGA
jgi:hypothetical protein